MQDHGRPTARGWGHGSQSISCLRGVPGTAGVQPPHQEGVLPFRSMPSAPPPPPAPERTWPQWGGWTRSALHDPVRLAANFCSSRWRKDLEHILQVYYKYNVDYFMEGDWSQVKKRFFDLFLQHKKEALEVKEARLLDFMVYIQDLFYQATGLDQEGELLSQDSSSTGSPPGVPPPGGSSLAQMAPGGSQQVPLGVTNEGRGPNP